MTDKKQKISREDMIKAVETANNDLIKQLEKKAKIDLIFLGVFTAVFMGLFEYKFALLYGGFWKGLIGLFIFLVDVVAYGLVLVVSTGGYLSNSNKAKLLKSLGDKKSVVFPTIADNLLKDINKKPAKNLFVKKSK